MERGVKKRLDKNIKHLKESTCVGAIAVPFNPNLTLEEITEISLYCQSEGVLAIKENWLNQQESNFTNIILELL